MTDFVELDQSFPNTVCSVDAAMLASTLTTMELNAGKSEADFPMDVKVYVRMRAYMVGVLTIGLLSLSSSHDVNITRPIMISNADFNIFFILLMLVC